MVMSLAVESGNCATYYHPNPATNPKVLHIVKMTLSNLKMRKTMTSPVKIKFYFERFMVT